MFDDRQIVAEGSIRMQFKDAFDSAYGTLEFTDERIISHTDSPVRFVHLARCVGGQVRFDLQLDATIQDDGAIRIEGGARFFAGLDCDPTFEKTAKELALTIPVDGTSEVEIRLEHRSGSEEDYAKGQITFANRDAPA